MATLKSVCSLEGHDERVWCCSWSPDKSMLATASSDKTIRIWAKIRVFNDAQPSNHSYKMECAQILDGHSRTVRCIAWHPSSKIFASAGFDRNVGIWRRMDDESESQSQSGAIEFECIDFLEGHDNEVKCVDWNCSGSLLASCSRDKSIWVWEMDDNLEFEVVSVMRSHDADIKSVVWHPGEEETLVSVSYDDTIKIWIGDNDDFHCIQTLKLHKNTVWSAAFDYSGNSFVTSSADNSIAVWHRNTAALSDSNGSDDITLNMCYKIVEQHSNLSNDPIYNVDWLSNNEINLIALCSGDNSIQILHQSKISIDDNNSDETNEEKSEQWSVLLADTTTHPSDVNWIAFGPKISAGIYWVATACDDGIVRIFQTDCSTLIDTNSVDTDSPFFNSVDTGIEYNTTDNNFVTEID